MTAKRPRPKLVRLKTPKGDDAMAITLLWLLERVRTGKIKAFSICLIGEREDGSAFSLESATADEDEVLELQLLGAMRGAEHCLFKRRWDRQQERATSE